MQWHQLDHMQTICTSLQTDNHTNTSSVNFTSRMLFTMANQQCQNTEGQMKCEVSHWDRPVPRGMMAIGGDWHWASWPTLSRHDNAQPTDPSPPHTRILKYGTLRNTYSLQQAADKTQLTTIEDGSITWAFQAVCNRAVHELTILDLWLFDLR